MIYIKEIWFVFILKKNQKNLLENIVLSSELLHGHSIRKISEEDIGRKIRFFIEGKYGKKIMMKIIYQNQY